MISTSYIFFFFNDTATTEIYTLSLHDALPICHPGPAQGFGDGFRADGEQQVRHQDRKSTRLNSSHLVISYAVFCLKKKIYEVRSILNKTFRTIQNEQTALIHSDIIHAVALDKN